MRRKVLSISNRAGLIKAAGVVFPAIGSAIHSVYDDSSRLRGISKWTGLGLGASLGAAAGGILGSGARNLGAPDEIALLSTLLGMGVGGTLGYTSLGDSMLEHHNRSKENELNSSKGKSNEEKDKSLEKKSYVPLIGGAIGAVHPEMSFLGGTARGVGIAGGGTLGALAGSSLGALIGAGIGRHTGERVMGPAMIGALIGGIPGMLYGGYKGHGWAKDVLKEHADLPDDHPAKKKSDSDKEKDKD